MDGIAGRSEIEDYLRVFSKIYVFEHGDVAYLQQMGLLGTYLPVGYNDAFSNVSPLEKKYDILFIGSPFRNRLQILEKLSFVALEKQWNLKIMGPFTIKCIRGRKSFSRESIRTFIIFWKIEEFRQKRRQSCMRRQRFA